MNQKFTLFTLTFCLLFSSWNTQAQENAEVAETPKTWETGAGLGLDFAQLFQFNPKQGAGQNRLGLGGAINIFAKYKKNRLAWDNLGSWQFGVQRLGTGVIAQGSTEKIPFQKAIDELRLNSKLGYQTSETSKFFYAVDFSFLSQITPTYEGTPTYAGFFLSDISGQNQDPLSQLFAPATITLSLGIDYKPNDHWTFYYSPLGSKYIIVTNDAIASRGVHGNPVEGEVNPLTNRYDVFENVDAQLGSLFRANYANKFWEERMAYTSALTLFSNYLRDPQNVDLDWTNELAIQVFKGLQLSFLVNAFYDHDVKVQVTDYDFPGGVKLDENGNIETLRRLSLTQQILIKYAVVF
ncbi:MAG TPA: DUF3078 domain-containing protein [Saprospiraceae bacterium]|nr:DUF3078 domain-containing protein [Saprospiraceae bacterium]HMQ84997.1 DUF3078 domain-containing protein [Saprospiraceae bacterium]